MADKRISQLIERVDIANNDVLPIVASGATTTNKVTVSTLQDWMQDNLDVGVTSVGLSMPSAFVVSNSPVTGSGNISVTGAGTVSQYIRGDGSLADFPSGGGGGGSSVNYYLNGSVSQGTIGGIAYREMNKVPVLGAGTDFVAIADGYLASFITDAGDPALLEIPGGNWNFETYFSASSGGGTPSFYVELYKVNSGGTATLIASNSGTPELIAFGTTITPYFSTLAVPTTSLALTDRLALRYYVARSGRTITLHTENSHLCQIITTFTTGLTALNGLTAQVQNFATGTSGTDFAISSSVSTHTFNLPDASASARGVVSTGTQTFAGYKIFNGTIGVNNDLQLVTVGTALNTFIKNINATGLTSIGSNGFGFNNANNIYFSGSSKGGGVFAFSNTGTQTYTLQDASGTLAFTSQIPTNPVGGTGAQGRVAYWNGAGTITSDSLFQWNDTFKRLGIGRTPTVSLDVEGAGFFSTSVTSQVSNISADGAGVVLQGYVDNNLRIAVRGSGYNSGARGGLIASTGDFSGALSGTSATFSGSVTATGTFISNVVNGYGLRLNRAAVTNFNGISHATGGVERWFVGMRENLSSNNYIIYNEATGIDTLTLNSTTGAATFSSSVTANYGGTFVIPTESPASGNVALTARTSNGANDIFRWFDGNTQLGVFKNSGNVGIGTASPGVKLQIVDTSQVRLDANAGGSQIQFWKDASPTFASSIGNYMPGGSLTNDLLFSIYNGTSWGERMRITSGGYLKATSDGTYVAVGNNFHEFTASQNGTDAFLVRHKGTDPYGSEVMFTGASPNNTSNWFFYASDSTNSKFIVYSNGNVVNRNNSYGAISDIKLKENIEDATPKLDDLMKVKVRNYNLIGDDKKQIGVIAQELEEVFPAMIDESEDLEEVEVPKLDEEGNEILNEEGEVVTEKQRVSKGTSTKSVKYSVFVPMLIKAIQELKTEIDSLKNQMQ